MKIIIIIVLVLFGFNHFNEQYKREQLERLDANASQTVRSSPNTFIETSKPVEAQAPVANTSRFTCDGRVHCSQMGSCEEATFFINSCPGTEMDGDSDGIPCESQWC